MWRKILVSIWAVASLCAADDYQLGPDSMPKEGVAKGRVEKFVFNDSKVFPGTQRDCWIYIPAQYDATKPAALMVFQDGGGYVSTNGQQRIPVVFDNLINSREMPVTIALFVQPGTRGTGPGSSNRSFEYDSLGDAYARFLIEEFIPFALQKFDVKISDDPDLHAICGMSSGGICAFTAAWERPNYFRKVLSQIGSFTNIRGGNNYPSIIRKTERKPIRVFLEDGSNDLNNLHGNWPLANQEMASALQFMGYDYRFVLGEGAHSGKHGGAIMPETLRWLWRPEMEQLPHPLTKDNLGGDEALSKVLPEQGGWELVGEGYGFTDAACGDGEGNFYFSDLNKGQVYKVAPGGKPAVWLDTGIKISGLKFGPDGRLYAATQGTVGGAKEEKKKIIAIDPKSKEITEISNGVQPNDLIVSKAGWIYFTDTGKGEVQRVPASAKNMAPQTVAGGMNKPNGISLSADQHFLIVSEYGGTNVWTYVVAPDGTAQSGERFMTLRTPAGRADSGGDGMTTDSQSRYYVTSHAGIQMFDWTGRLGGVIAKPTDKMCVSVAFAGPGNEYLYACASDKVFRRKMLVKGAIFTGK